MDLNVVYARPLFSRSSVAATSSSRVLLRRHYGAAPLHDIDAPSSLIDIIALAAMASTRCRAASAPSRRWRAGEGGRHRHAIGAIRERDASFHRRDSRVRLCRSSRT